MDLDDIDFDNLRQDLIDYFGPATPSYPIAMSDVINVETASDLELLNIAASIGWDINNYVKGDYTNQF